jgi:aryl-alcohol dehydrogenase-like predicted oxidoreductase
MAAWKFAQALSLSERSGWARFVTMQNHYNLIYREEEREMVPLCQAEGIGLIPWSPLARGLLAGTRKTPDDKTPTARATSDDFAWKLYDHPADIEVMRACQTVAERLGIQPAQVAIAWLLTKPAMTAPIIGATKIEHLEAAIAAVDLKLGDEEIRQLEAPYQPHAVRGFD